MFWQTLWALILGFGLSGAGQAFIFRRQMHRAMGSHRPVAIVRGSLQSRPDLATERTP